MLVVGVATDDVEWVLAIHKLPEQPITLLAVNYGFPDPSDQTDLYFIVQSKEVLDAGRRPKTMTLQIRHQRDSNDGDKSPAIIASYDVSQAWQWNVLGQEGLIVHFQDGSPDRDRDGRTIFATTVHEFELVAYAGTPARPEPADLTSLELQVTGWWYKSGRKQRYVDLTARKRLLTGVGEPDEDSLYKDFSGAAGRTWKFQEVKFK